MTSAVTKSFPSSGTRSFTACPAGATSEADEPVALELASRLAATDVGCLIVVLREAVKERPALERIDIAMMKVGKRSA